ncbi:MAG: response regulator [Planctomycetota bacterium]
MLKSRILLVDDEKVFTGNMSKLLENRGYIVNAVNSGEEAVEAMSRLKFDVVVLDLKMPGMDGLATLAEINKLGIFTEVLILTGHGSIDSALEAMKIGAYDYLTKPCEIDQLVEKIEGAWQRKDEVEKKDMEEKIKKIVESPSAVLDMLPGKKKKEGKK